MILGSLRTLPTLALTTAARTLRLLASVNEAIADRLNPDSGSAGTDKPTPTRARPAAAPQPARPSGPAVTSPPPTVDIATLASRNAPEVIAAIEGLSTTELGELYDHESGHRRRRTVLAAIEAASVPPAPADEPDDLPELDVRVADELVYSTATPRR